jgi:hypothetical protein
VGAREAHPALTEKIVVEIIARLDDLWSNHAPLSEFKLHSMNWRLHGDVGKLLANEL